MLFYVKCYSFSFSFFFLKIYILSSRSSVAVNRSEKTESPDSKRKGKDFL